MIKRLFFILLMISCSNKVSKQPMLDIVETEDFYHGYTIKDPYRNMENLKDSTVIKWLRTQGNYAVEILKKNPRRQFLIEEQKKFDQRNLFKVSRIKNTLDGKWFYKKTIAGENLGKLYYRLHKNEKEQLLYDPSNYKSGDYIINYLKPDWKGEKIVVSLSKQGEEISELIVVDVATKNVLSGEIKNSNPGSEGIQWLPDNSGFIYLHSPVIDPNDPNYGLNTKSVVYQLGDDPIELKEVFSKTNNPDLNLKSEDFPLVYINTDYDDYVFGEVSGSSPFKDMYFKTSENLLSNEEEWKLLYRESDMVEKIALNGEELILLSAKNASNYQIAKTSMLDPDFENPEILIPENESGVISDFEVTKEGIFFVRVKNGVEAKLFRYFDGNEREIKTPNPSGKIRIDSKGSKYGYLKVSCLGWINSTITYEYDIINDRFVNINLNPLSTHKEFKSLVVEEIEVSSHDGIMVPLSLIYKDGIKKDQNNPTLFYGYGSYGSSTGPFFSPGFLNWVTEGGILAIAHVRGGGEKGEGWHKAGSKVNKPNTWKDMIACTEYMIKEGYTKPEKSAIWGTSAGGIMAGRAMTERPDLYAAVILYSPSLNLVRSEIQPNGPNSVKEFGTVKIKEEFEALLEMDSYHQIKENTNYPATLIAAGVKDGRVVVWDPAKFAARLQAANSSNNPILFAVDFEAGHGGKNSGALKVYEQFANTLSFAFWQTGHPDYQPE